MEISFQRFLLLGMNLREFLDIILILIHLRRRTSHETSGFEEQGGIASDFFGEVITNIDTTD